MNTEDVICSECSEQCTYYLYVHIRGHDKEIYLDERCDKLIEEDELYNKGITNEKDRDLGSRTT